MRWTLVLVTCKKASLGSVCFRCRGRRQTQWRTQFRKRQNPKVSFCPPTLIRQVRPDSGVSVLAFSPPHHELMEVKPVAEFPPYLKAHASILCIALIAGLASSLYSNWFNILSPGFIHKLPHDTHPFTSTKSDQTK